jgi:hypothetical protein
MGHHSVSPFDFALVVRLREEQNESRQSGVALEVERLAEVEQPVEPDTEELEELPALDVKKQQTVVGAVVEVYSSNPQ